MDEKKVESWIVPPLMDEIPHGDMPGDKIEINERHVAKAQTIFPLLMRELVEMPTSKIVVSVYGGSGVGKSETASLLGYYLNSSGIGAYIMSGDNYVHRIPKYNDKKREQVFEEGGINALRGHLGSEHEINFKEVNEIIRQFHEGVEKIYLRRMGRSEMELWYEPVDFSKIQVLILEWTHGNSDYLRGVDIPIMLSSTPQETLEHRRKRNRDGDPDSPFVMMVLDIEQELIISQIHKAKIIISKQNEVLTAEEFLERLEASKHQDGK